MKFDITIEIKGSIECDENERKYAEAESFIERIKREISEEIAAMHK